MTSREAKQLGYEVVRASSFEVGLLKNSKGIRTWFAQEFKGKLPPLNHPEIQRAIKITEEYEIES